MILLDEDGTIWYYYDDEIETAKKIRTAGGTHYDSDGNIVGEYKSTTNYTDFVPTGNWITVEVPEVGHYETRVIEAGHYEKTGKKYCPLCGEVK